jgi:hypothetical protein
MSTLGGVNIFVSSTYVDLKEIRAEVIKWLRGVFEADLTIMETFGSDAAPPDILSVRRVRDCDLFVGIYAHRYGTVDPISGESITELELDEAKRSLSAGTLKDILLYVIDEKSCWMSEHEDKNPVAAAGRKRLRQKTAEHTCSPFKTGVDLPFLIVRDVRRKLDQHFSELPARVRRFSLPAPRRLSQPVGMEFLTSQFQRYLISRHDKVDELANRLRQDPTVLVLGESGVGKTSLIHAGLIPTVVKQGFRPVYSRPLGLPCSDIVQQVYSTIFGGAKSHRAELPAVVAEAEAALRGKTLLLIIDQFEDVLASRHSEEVKALVSSLTTLRNLSSPTFRTMIVYRADLEGRLGEFWQAMSGSPNGLPRVYLGGLAPDKLWAELACSLRDLSIQLKLRPTEAHRIVTDLVNASHGTGVDGAYPPYVQMLIDHLWKESRSAGAPLAFTDYERAGGVAGIVGSYLSHQLAYAQDAGGHLKSVLVSLVRSYGVKAQKELHEVQGDTGLTKPESEAALEKLIDLRLVRHISTYYEVSHDFVARKIINELADSDEREFKRFRELLASKAAAYATTRSLLTSDEMLMLYKHRQRILPSDAELGILLASWLAGAGPALYWLLRLPEQTFKDLLARAQQGVDTSSDEYAMVVLLRRKLGDVLFPNGDFSSFRGYKRSWELVGLMTIAPKEMPQEVLLYGLRHAREEVREAALRAITASINAGKHDWIARLRNSSSSPVFQAYLRSALRHDAGPLGCGSGHSCLTEFVRLRNLAQAATPSETKTRAREVLRLRPPGRVSVFAKGLLLLKTGRLSALLNLCERLPRKKATAALEAIGAGVSAKDYKTLLVRFARWIRKPAEWFQSSSNYAKALALSEAIYRASRTDLMPILRREISRLPLKWPSRPLFLAILKHGNMRDLRSLVNLIRVSKDKIDVWNHTQIGHEAAALATKSRRGIPKYLAEMLHRKDFWVYLSAQARRAVAANEILPLEDPDNRPFLIRLVGYAVIGAAQKNDEETLVRLCAHNYSMIARAAALRLADLFGDRALGILAERVDAAVRERTIESLATAVIYAEMSIYGLTSPAQRQ